MLKKSPTRTKPQTNPSNANAKCYVDANISIKFFNLLCPTFLPMHSTQRRANQGTNARARAPIPPTPEPVAADGAPTRLPLALSVPFGAQSARVLLLLLVCLALVLLLVRGGTAAIGRRLRFCRCRQVGYARVAAASVVPLHARRHDRAARRRAGARTRLRPLASGLLLGQTVRVEGAEALAVLALVGLAAAAAVAVDRGSRSG